MTKSETIDIKVPVKCLSDAHVKGELTADSEDQSTCVINPTDTEPLTTRPG